MAIFNRLPTLKQIAPVYAISVVIIYSWTTWWFFWKLPSWLFYMNIGEIILVYVYLLAVNFIESLIALCAPLVLSFILPQKWFRDLFVVRGASLIIVGLGYAIFLTEQFQYKDAYPSLYLKLWAVALAVGLIALLVFATGKISAIKKVIEVIADRAMIFLFIYVPLSIISLLIVLYRLL